MNGSITHIVGPGITFYMEGGPHYRQRCAWCGAVLLECENTDPDEYEELSQVRVICGTLEVIETPILGSGEAEIPGDSCLWIDPIVTM